MTLAQWLEKSSVVGKVYDGSIRLTKNKTIESKPKMTYELAMAAAKDAANRHMRAGGRTKWDESDYNEMVRVFNELWPEGSETESIVETLLGCDL